jgi:hypothetical protein
VAGSCEYGDEPSDSGATKLVSYVQYGTHRMWTKKKSTNTSDVIKCPFANYNNS